MKTIKECMEELDKAVENFKQAMKEQEVKEVKKQEILVPDNIWIEKCNDYYYLGFGENQTLFCIRGEDFYRVTHRDLEYRIKAKLIPCKRKDLKAGDLAFMSDFENPDFGCLENYCVILDDKKYSWIADNESVSVSDFSCGRWWKVVEA